MMHLPPMRGGREIMTMLRTLLCAFTMLTAPAQHPSMPPGMTHEEHLRQMAKDAELKRRGNDAMGFDQDKTTHHFRLTEAGGLIEVRVNDPADTVSRDQVRAHLKIIAAELRRGVFDKPFATHGEMPPGTQIMVNRRDAITCVFEESAAGALVRIQTALLDAREAIHAFLRYQIREHRTGDSLQIAK
jgi:hypothetical protein